MRSPFRLFPAMPRRATFLIGLPAIVALLAGGWWLLSGNGEPHGAPLTQKVVIGDVLEAYERLILDAMRGDHTLFTTAEGIERLWEVSMPLLDAPPPVRSYPPGSWGPNAIHQLIAPHAWRLPFERVWRDPNRQGS